MVKILSVLLIVALGIMPLSPPLATIQTQSDGGGTLETGAEEEFSEVGLSEISSNAKILEKKATAKKTCQSGYFRNPTTGRCKKLVTVSETSSTITTKTYNPNTGKATVKKVCKKGYWWNKKSERCNKKKECKIGYLWQSKNNSCKKIICKIGFKVQDRSNVCKRLVCEKGHIINQKTGNCVKNRNGKYKTCPAGWTLDLRTLECAKIGTKGSDDPASKNAKKSMKLANFYETKSLKVLANIQTESEITSESQKKECPEGKFLNPKTNRCKNLQEINETSTGKTITTYDPETGEGTTVKVCNEGYELNESTNRCNKIKTETEKSSSSSSKSSSSTSSKSSNEMKTCPEGKFLNPKTNRCKNLETVSESTTGKTITRYDPKTGEATTEKICNEGYELNPETNRCKKAKKNDGENYALAVPELGGKPNFIAIGSVIAILAAGIGFVIFEFRHEIAKFFKRFVRRKKPKDMV